MTKVVQKQHILLLSASFIYLVWRKNTIKVSFLNIFAQFKGQLGLLTNFCPQLKPKNVWVKTPHQFWNSTETYSFSQHYDILTVSFFGFFSFQFPVSHLRQLWRQFTHWLSSIVSLLSIMFHYILQFLLHFQVAVDCIEVITDQLLQLCAKLELNAVKNMWEQ